MKLGIRGAIVAAALLLGAAPALAQTPDYEGEFFTDLTHQVPARKQVDISRTLRGALESSHVHPMLVVIERRSTYPSLPQSKNEFATRLLLDWKVGEVGTHEGMLVLFSLGDRDFFIAKTTNVPVSVTNAIEAEFERGVLARLKATDVSGAMELAARDIAECLPRYTGSSSTSSTSTNTPPSSPTHTTTRTVHEHRVWGSSPGWSGGSGIGGAGYVLGCCSVPGIGMLIVLFVVIKVIGAIFSSGSGYGRSYGRYYGGGGGSGWWGGMATGGLLGYLFGSSGSGYGGYGSGWGGGGSYDTSYTDTTTTDTWSSSSGGSSDWSSGSSGGSDWSSGSGGVDTFGGGTSDGSGSGGSW